MRQPFPFSTHPVACPCHKLCKEIDSAIEMPKIQYSQSHNDRSVPSTSQFAFSYAVTGRKLQPFHRAYHKQRKQAKAVSPQEIPIHRSGTALHQAPNPRKAIRDMNRYFLSFISWPQVATSTATQKSIEQSTAGFVIVACRENVYHGWKVIPFPVSSPKSTLFCHKITNPLGSNAEPKPRIFLIGTFETNPPTDTIRRWASRPTENLA